MSRKVVRMTLDHLAELDAPCRSCVFWELDPVRRGRVDEPAAEKEAWMSEVLRDWGSCGRVMMLDDEPVGYALYAPPAYLPGAGAFPTAPVSPHAARPSTGGGRTARSGRLRMWCAPSGCPPPLPGSPDVRGSRYMSAVATPPK